MRMSCTWGRSFSPAVALLQRTPRLYSPYTPRMTSPVSDPIRGAPPGLACGDALGAPAEFKTATTVNRRTENAPRHGDLPLRTSGLTPPPPSPPEEVRRHGLSQSPRERIGPLALVGDIVGRPEEDVRRRARANARAASRRIAGYWLPLLTMVDVALAGAATSAS